jgi:glycerol-3-phosphate acyltransferase PlsY
LTFAAIVAAGYLLGSCPWGYWLVRIFRHEDVRLHGSGGIGASNVWRTYGRRLGLPVVALDFLKGFAPALVGVHEVSHLCGILAGAAAMLGHARPIWLRFEKGGKMVATGGGVFFAIAPFVAVSALALWAAVFLVFGYSSVASLCVAVYVAPASWAFGYPGPVIVFAAIAGGIVVGLHRSNLSRLYHRREHRSSVAISPRLFPRRN